MKNKTIFLITMLIVLSGCTNQSDNEPVVPTGMINFGYNLNPTTISQGDTAVITMSISNYYDEPLNNLDVRFEPTFSGINFNINGPSTIEPGNTGTWVVDLDSSSGVVAKSYTFRPVICFDYEQEKTGFFRVAPEEPSNRDVDYSASTIGPLIINFANLRGINAKSDYNSLDMTITYSFANNYQGLTNYSSIDNQVLSSGSFKLESNDLSLRALQGSARLSPSSIPDPNTNYCRKIQTFDGATVSECLFYHSDSTKVFLNSQFGFRVVVEDSLASELETYLKHELSYRICLKPVSDFSLTVVKAQ